MKRMVCVWRGCGDEKSGSMHGRAHGGCETDGDVCVCVCVCVWCKSMHCTALHCTCVDIRSHGLCAWVCVWERRLRAGSNKEGAREEDCLKSDKTTR
jgi:hypothetical protein